MSINLNIKTNKVSVGSPCSNPDDCISKICINNICQLGVETEEELLRKANQLQNNTLNKVDNKESKLQE